MEKWMCMRFLIEIIEIIEMIKYFRNSLLF